MSVANSPGPSLLYTQQFIIEPTPNHSSQRLDSCEEDSSSEGMLESRAEVDLGFSDKYEVFREA